MTCESFLPPKNAKRFESFKLESLIRVSTTHLSESLTGPCFINLEYRVFPGKNRGMEKNPSEIWPFPGKSR